MLRRNVKMQLVATLFEQHHDVATLRTLLKDLQPKDILPMREQVKFRRLQATLDNKPGDAAYCDLITRVIDSITVKAELPMNFIHIGKICMVPVNWSDDSTTDATANENMRRWFQNGDLGEQLLTLAQQSGAPALHFFDPQALKRRTAHVTTESFIRLMKEAKDA